MATRQPKPALKDIIGFPDFGVKPFKQGVFTVAQRNGRTLRYPAVAFDALCPGLSQILVRDWKRVAGISYRAEQLMRYAQCYIHWAQYPQAGTVKRLSNGYTIAHIAFIHPAEGWPGMFSAAGLYYAKGGTFEDLPYISDINYHSAVLLSEPELEDYCPGSVERLRVAHALSYTGTDLTRHAFSPQPILQVGYHSALVLPDAVTLD